MLSVTPPVVLWPTSHLPDFQKFKLHVGKIWKTFRYSKINNNVWHWNDQMIQTADLRLWVDSIAASLFVLNWLSWQKVSDDKIQITILILRQGALSTYGAVICKVWSAIENLAVWSKNQKCGIFTLNLTVIRTILAVKQRENGKNNDYTHITDPGVLLNSGHDFIRLLSFARLRWESVTMSLISSTSWSALSPIFSLVENAR